MCGGASILRIIATVFLVIAFLAALVGFVAPFWTERVDRSTLSTTLATPALLPDVPTLSTRLIPTTTPTTRRSSTVGGEEGQEWDFEGLWAKCLRNTTCECFAQHGFKMEIEFADWHKAVQGLFGIGLIILFVAIVTISCNICCCRCCRESSAIATACAVLVLIGLFVILVSLAVYGWYAYLENGVGLFGPKRFFWGFYLSISAAGLAILPAILFICDGRREILPEHEDCETAKMV